MKIYCVRHGKTDYNKHGRVMGYIDKPLNDEGLQQVQQLAEDLKDEHFDLIYCSPLMRAKQTAAAINEYQKCPIFYDHRVIERDCGMLAGVHYNDLDKEKSKWSWKIGDDRCKQYKVETVDSMMARVQNLVDQIAEDWSDKKVLIVSHSGVAMVLNALQENLKEGDDIFKKIKTPNAELMQFDVQPTNKQEKE